MNILITIYHTNHVDLGRIKGFKSDIRNDAPKRMNLNRILGMERDGYKLITFLRSPEHVRISMDHMHDIAKVSS